MIRLYLKGFFLLYLIGFLIKIDQFYYGGYGQKRIINCFLGIFMFEGWKVS